MFLHVGNQLFVLPGSEPLLVQKKPFETSDRIPLAPVLKERLGNIFSGVVDRVSLHAHHLGFNQGRPFCATGTLAGFAGRIVDLAGVGTVHNHARDAICNGPLREILDAELHIARSGVSPEIIFDKQDETKLLHGSKVQALISDSS